MWLRRRWLSLLALLLLAPLLVGLSISAMALNTAGDTEVMAIVVGDVRGELVESVNDVIELTILCEGEACVTCSAVLDEPTIIIEKGGVVLGVVTNESNPNAITPEIIESLEGAEYIPVLGTDKLVPYYTYQEFLECVMDGPCAYRPNNYLERSLMLLAIGIVLLAGVVGYYRRQLEELDGGEGREKTENVVSESS